MQALLIGLPAVLLLFVPIGLVGVTLGDWLVARQVDVERSARLAAAAVCTAWVMIVVFLALAAAGIFFLLPCIGAWWLLAGLARWRRPGAWSRLREDLGSVGRDLNEAARRPGIEHVGWTATLALLGVKVAQGLVSPPQAWDSLTYHLPKCVTWIQTGRLALPDAADGWSFYRHYAYGAEILWTWPMLATRSDSLLAPAGLLVWGALLLGVYRLARELGAERRSARLLAMAIGSMPVALMFVSAAYVDTATAAFVLLGLSFFLRFLRRPGVAAGVLAMGSLGVAGATKVPGALIMGALSVMLVARTLVDRERAARDRGLGVVAAAVAAALPCGVYGSVWLEMGSPFYPWGVPGGGVLGFPVHDGVAAIVAGATVDPVLLEVSTGELLQRLFWFPPAGFTQLNWGLGGAALALAAVAGLTRSKELLVRNGPWVVTAVALGALLPWPSVLSPDTLTMRTLWLDVFARLVLPSSILLALPALALPGRIFATVALTVTALNLAMWRPAGIGPATLDAWKDAASGLLITAAIVGVVVFLVLRRLAEVHGTALLFVGLVVVLGAGDVQDARDDARYAIWAESYDPPRSFDLHALDQAITAAWPLWEAVDEHHPHRISYHAGAAALADNAYRYPLYGARLQNELVYVPVTRSGDIVELFDADRLAAEADYDAWRARLLEQEVDLVMTAYPRGIEVDWLLAHPEHFERVASPIRSENGLWRVLP